MRKHLSIVFVAAAVSQVGATDCGQVIRDPGFDLWCGTELCSWKIERGDVRQVPTWHEGDSGVELVGADVAIEQFASVNSDDGTCLKFDLISNVADTAEVFLNVDVESDGTSEMHERLPTSRWKPLSYTFAVAAPYDSIRFELTKAGPGTAVVAQIQAETRPAADCEGLTVLDPGPRRNGARCNLDLDPMTNGTECASGLCRQSPTPLPGAPWFDLACVGCDPSLGAAACPIAGETCGLGDPASPFLAVPTECVPIAAREVGEKCVGNTECASSLCIRVNGAATGVCSACAGSGTCRNNVACGAGWASQGFAESGPLVCGPGLHLGLAGDACASSDDCASSACIGTERKECNDGRACGSPANCPVDDGLAPGPCTTVGIQGGTCG